MAEEQNQLQPSDGGCFGLLGHMASDGGDRGRLKKEIDQHSSQCVGVLLILFILGYMICQLQCHPSYSLYSFVLSFFV